MERPPAPPEAVLIRLAREAAGIPVAAAAKRAGVSVARWSQIESGSEIRHGAVSPVTGRAGTIARMAAEVGVSPERMETEGQRPDAAEILREILRREIPPGTRGPQPGQDLLPGATPEMELAMEAHLARIRDRLEVARAAHPGGKLTGAMVFPRSPRDAESWDQLASLGWAPEAVARGLAALLAWDEQKSASGAESGFAAGLAAAEVTQQ